MPLWVKDQGVWKPIAGGGPPPPPPTYEYEYLVAAGGGGAGVDSQGAGAGGVLNEKFTPEYGRQYNVIVGAGGAGAPTGQNLYGTQGENSYFDNIETFGGAFCYNEWNTSAQYINGQNGGSGSGCYRRRDLTIGEPGKGVEGQGHDGGTLFNGGVSPNPEAGFSGGGGAGSSPPPVNILAYDLANGGDGLETYIRGYQEYFGGGGAGWSRDPSNNAQKCYGGKGGGGNNGYPVNTRPGDCKSDVVGLPNTGGGGGVQAFNCPVVPNGGSGVVILKEPVSAQIADTNGNPEITYYDNWRVYTFTGSGTIIFKNPLSPTYSVQALLVSGGGGGSNEGGATGGGGSDVQKRYFDLEKGKTYIVTVGAGGVGGLISNATTFNNGTDGEISSILDIGSCSPGQCSRSTNFPAYGGSSGNGYSGGRSWESSYPQCEGGGAGGAGGPGISSNRRFNGGSGGPGASREGFPGIYGGGGGGAGSVQYGIGAGGTGGGGAGAYYLVSDGATYEGYSGQPNSGGGGGSGIGWFGDSKYPFRDGYNGGSGIVIVKYPNTYARPTVTGDPIVEDRDGYWWITFTGSGSIMI